MLKYFALLFSCCLISLENIAQELNCEFTILTPQIQASDKSIYDKLQTDLRDFMNNRKWTNDEYLNQERIECSITITISERVSTDEFKASIQIQSRRPVYRSSYNSPLFNHEDKELTFRYVQDQPVEFDDANINNNLTATLGYYAYIILGLDYDTFSPEGGTPFFVKAQNIVNNAQNIPDRGWRAFESQRNRFWLVENLLNVVFKPLRNFEYTYHRLGFDKFSENIPDARAEIANKMADLMKVYQDKPNSFLMQVFFNAKSDEIINIFSQGTNDEKTRVLQVLTKVDPAHSLQYQAITTGGK